MKSINRVTFLGHIVADPQGKVTKTGKDVSTFALATNNEWLDAEGELKKSTDFHRVVAWEGLARLCKTHLKKGTPVYIEGRLSNRSYEGKDKTRHFITEVVAKNVNILKWEDSRKTIQTKELAAV
jgi:single-strand DNA-binding protein